MKVARDTGPTEEQLVRYLLGQLPADEAERLDEAAIVDDDIAARLTRVEDDLVDRYVVDALDAVTRDRFEAHYLGTARRREKVEFARRFMPAIDRAAAPRPAQVARNGRNLVWPLVAIAASLLVASGLLVVNDVQLRSALDALRQERGERDIRTRSLEAQLAAARDAAARAATRAEQAAQNVAAGRSRLSERLSSGLPAIAALVLSPQRRSLESMPTIAATADDRILVELRIEANEHERYQVVLTDSQTTRVAWRSGTVTPHVSGGASFVAVDVPAAGLESRRYTFELSGVDQSGRADPVATYAFELDRR